MAIDWHHSPDTGNIPIGELPESIQTSFPGCTTHIRMMNGKTVHLVGCNCDYCKGLRYTQDLEIKIEAARVATSEACSSLGQGELRIWELYKILGILGAKPNPRAQPPTELETLKEALRSVQWDRLTRTCPLCGQIPAHGHSTTCQIGLALGTAGTGFQP